MGGECLPRAALAPALPGGSCRSCRRQAAGPGQERGTSGMGVNWDGATSLSPLPRPRPETTAGPWADVCWCPLGGCGFSGPQGDLTCRRPTESLAVPSAVPSTQRCLGTRMALWPCPPWLPNPCFQCPWELCGVLGRRQEGSRGLLSVQNV